MAGIKRFLCRMHPNSVRKAADVKFQDILLCANAGIAWSDIVGSGFGIIKFWFHKLTFRRE